MKKVRQQKEPAERVPPELAAMFEENYGDEQLRPMLDPFPSVEAARAFRVREAMEDRSSEAASDPPTIARDVEVARDPAKHEAERAAAIVRVADWLSRKWRVPDELKRTLARMAHELETPESKPGRRAPGRHSGERKKIPPTRDKPATYSTVKRRILAEAAYLAMAEDALAIPVSRRRLNVRAKRSFMPLTVIYGKLTHEDAQDFLPLVEGLWVPGAFGWWSLYRDWLIKRARFHAERRLDAARREDVVNPKAKEAETHFEQERSESEDLNAEAQDRESRLAQLIAALPNEEARRTVRALEPRWQFFLACALGADAHGRSILLPKQGRVVVAWAKHGGDRARAYESIGMGRSAGDKVLNRAFERLRAVGLHALVT